MAVDVSGLVNMLATQPGQNVANIGAQISAAQDYATKQRQQQFENERNSAKDAIERALKQQQMKVSQLEEIKTKADIAVPIVQQLAMSKDPLVRRQLFESSVPVLQQIGMGEPQLEEFRQNIDNPDFILSKVAQGLAAKDVWEMNQPKETTTADDFTRAVAMRDQITSKLKSSPNDPRLMQTLEDVNARIAKLTSQGLSPTARAGMEEAAKGRAKYLQSGAEAVRESAVNASDSVQNLTMAKNILSQGLETGAFQPAVSGINRYLKDAGIEIPGLNEVSDVEVFNTMMSREIVTELANMDKPSDKDAELVKNMTASIKNDEQAAKFLVDAAIATKKRKVEKHEFYEDYWQTHKTYETDTNSVEQAWATYVKDTPLVGKRVSDGFTVTWPEFKEAYQTKWGDAPLNEIIDSWNSNYAH